MDDRDSNFTAGFVFPRNHPLNGLFLELTLSDPKGFVIHVSDGSNTNDTNLKHKVLFTFCKDESTEAGRVGLYTFSNIPEECSFNIEKVTLESSIKSNTPFPDQFEIFIIESSDVKEFSHKTSEGEETFLTRMGSDIKFDIYGESKYCEVGGLQNPRRSSFQSFELMPEKKLSQALRSDSYIIHDYGIFHLLIPPVYPRDIENDNVIRITFSCEGKNLGFKIFLGVLSVRYSLFEKINSGMHYLVFKEKVS